MQVVLSLLAVTACFTAVACVACRPSYCGSASVREVSASKGLQSEAAVQLDGVPVMTSNLALRRCVALARLGLWRLTSGSGLADEMSAESRACVESSVQARFCEGLTSEGSIVGSAVD